MAARHARHIYLVTVALCLRVLAADAQPAVQAIDSTPHSSRPSSLHVLSAADHDIFARAFAAGARDDWAGALALGNQGQDSVARQLLQWRYALDRNSGVSFADIDAAIKMAADWPLKGTLYTRAEQAITPDMPASQVIAWFGSRAPVSSIGKIRLGEALGGQTAQGAALIRQGWSEGSFDDATEAGILAKDATYLTPDSDKTRLDILLWQGQFTAARRQMARVDADSAAVAQARIALDGGLLRAKPYLDRLADSRNPALLFDWARQLRLAHQNQAAHDKLLQAAPALLARDHTARWWGEVNAQARDALSSGDPRTALALVDHAMLPIGDSYADQQFLGGFISLRFLKDPGRALTYFRQLSANVSRPISKSRAEYWQARAYEALGDTTNAYAHYRTAAAYPETFYGQLAIARTQSAPLLHVNDTQVTPDPKAEIESDALMPAIKVLAELGQTGDLLLFAQKDADTYRAPAHLKQFLQSLSDWGYADVAVRLAKASGFVGVPLLALAYPVLPLPPVAIQAPEPALVLALIRQETEFNPYAVSTANARGLMQMMLPSARKAAKDGGLPYRPDALLSDPQYNMQLGQIEYAGHLADTGGSYVLAAASYDAGPSNVKKWLATNGDPRAGTDPIDWIEQIPFEETRNYVERVLENTEVYRDRLAGTDQPLRIMTDLYAPASPPGGVLSAPVKVKAN